MVSDEDVQISDGGRFMLGLVNLVGGYLVSAYLFLELGAFIMSIGTMMVAYSIIQILKRPF